MSDENTFVRHTACPECPSSDAFAVYSDGGGYCFSCGHSVRGDGESLPTASNTVSINYAGDFAGIRSRKITEDTCKKFNVRVDAGPVIRFPYYDSSGRVCAYKERPQNKSSGG